MKSKHSKKRYRLNKVGKTFFACLVLVPSILALCAFIKIPNKQLSEISETASMAAIRKEQMVHVEECAPRQSLKEYVEQTYQKDLVILSKLLYRECRGVPSDTEKACVCWCVYNRVNNPQYPNTVKEVVQQDKQFAWENNTPVENELYEIALNTYVEFYKKQNGCENYRQILPDKYTCFRGFNGHNWFREEKGDHYWNMSIAYIPA